MIFKSTIKTTHKGFTLIELLIVIVIVSLVYALGLSDIDFTRSKANAITPFNLKKSIVNSKSFNGHTTLLCVDNGKECYLRKDIGGKFNKYNNIDLKGIKAYTIDSSNNLIEMEYERYNDKKISLKMDFYDNGSSTQMIIKQKDKIYFLPALFGKVREFNSLEDAKDYWLNNSQLVSDSGDFY